jgi:hypothetical protein
LNSTQFCRSLNQASPKYANDITGPNMCYNINLICAFAHKRFQRLLGLE